MDLTYYPINDFGPVMKGMIIGGLGIFHVFLAQFAIGAGFLMCYFQWLAQTGRSTYARFFLDSYFKVLVLVSFVLGALCSGAAGFIGMKVATKANVRTTHAARTSLSKALEVAFQGGSAMGMGVVGLGVLGLSLLFIIYGGMFGTDEVGINRVITVITGFSSPALALP